MRVNGSCSMPFTASAGVTAGRSRSRACCTTCMRASTSLSAHTSPWYALLPKCARRRYGWPSWAPCSSSRLPSTGTAATISRTIAATAERARTGATGWSIASCGSPRSDTCRSTRCAGSIRCAPPHPPPPTPNALPILPPLHPAPHPLCTPPCPLLHPTLHPTLLPTPALRPHTQNAPTPLTVAPNGCA